MKVGDAARPAGLLALTLLLCPVPAPAQSPPPTGNLSQVEQLARAARDHYAAERFGQAVAVYLEAYRLAPAAAVLYNIALIYDRKLDEPQLAIDFYRRYIGSPDADPQAVQRATQRVQVLKAEQKKAEVPLPGPPPPEVAETSDAGTSTQALTGWIAVGVGGALIGAGVTFGVLANDKADRFHDITEADRSGLRDEGQTQALTADILFGVGAAAGITGVVLLLLDAGEAQALRVAPTPGGALVGLATTWGTP